MSTKRETKTINIEQGDDEYQIVFSLKYETYLYGQDTDGNRGEQRTELLDSEIVEAYKNGHKILVEHVPSDVISQAGKEVEE